MAIFEVASERKIVKNRGILAARMYMDNIGSTPPGDICNDRPFYQFIYVVIIYLRVTVPRVCGL